MALLKKRTNFLDSQEGHDIRQILLDMTGDSTYNTVSSYSTNLEKYPDNLIPFIDKHMDYLNSHPTLEAKLYIANIKLITRVR